MKTETIKTIVIIVLGAFSIALYLDEKCVIDWIKSDCQAQFADDVSSEDNTMNNSEIGPDSVDVNGGPCDDSQRYPVNGNWSELPDGGKQIIKADAKKLIDNFQKTLHSKGLQIWDSGVFISKRAIDQMFKTDLKSNGLVAYFAIDKGYYNLVFSPARSYHTKLFPQTTPPITDNIFVAETWCPNVCGIFQEFCLPQHCEDPPF